MSSVVRPSTCMSPPRAPRSAASPRVSASCAARCGSGSRSTGPARRPLLKRRAGLPTAGLQVARPLQHSPPSHLVRLPVPVHLRGPPGRYPADRRVITPRIQDPGVGPRCTCERRPLWSRRRTWEPGFRLEARALEVRLARPSPIEDGGWSFPFVKSSREVFE
jgi:hypothetical protein